MFHLMKFTRIFVLSYFWNVIYIKFYYVSNIEKKKYSWLYKKKCFKKKFLRYIYMILFQREKSFIWKNRTPKTELEDI